MPNEDIDVSNLDRLEKYRSFDRYRRQAEREARAPHWWRTYREHFGEQSGAGRTRDSGRVLPSFGGEPARVPLRTVGGVVPATTDLRVCCPRHLEGSLPPLREPYLTHFYPLNPFLAASRPAILS